MAFRVAHISDLHVQNLAKTTVFTYLNKRITGGANLLLKRSRSHSNEVVKQALQQIADMNVDHIVVTGDLSNLSLDGEFDRAKRLLRKHGDGDRISVVPGNHDRYTFRSARLRRFETYFGEFQQSDLPEFQKESVYPYAKLRDGLAIIGISSSVPTLPLFATGRVSRCQLDCLRAILAHPEIERRAVLVVVHHHLLKPPYRAFDGLRRMVNAKTLRQVLTEGGADVVVHGHNHVPGLVELPDAANASGLTRVFEAGSTSATHSGKHAAKFNIYEFSDGRLNQVSRYQLSGSGTAPFDSFETLEFGSAR